MSDYTVVRGDALSAMRAMRDYSVHSVVTDWPYGEVNDIDDHGGLRKTNKGDADLLTVDPEETVAEMLRVAAGWVYVWCGFEQASTLVSLFRSRGATARIGVWHKSDPSPMNGDRIWTSAVELCAIARKPCAYFSRRCAAPVWSGPTERGIDWHPTPKPVWLMRELVTASVPVGGIVLDPFMGSAPVGVACLLEQRDFVGVDLNPEYVDRARRRLAGVNLDLFHGAEAGCLECEAGREQGGGDA